MTNLSKRIDTDDVSDLAITLGKLSTAVQAILAGAGGASPLTTKGDLFTHTTVDARLALGSQGQVLSVNTGAASGLTWIDFSPLVAKGDLYTFAGGSPARLPVGANNKVLIADSGQTDGIKWGDAPAPDLSGYSLTGADPNYLPKVQTWNRTFVNAGILTDAGSGNFSAGAASIYYCPMDSSPATVFASYTMSINTTGVDGARFRFMFPAGVTAFTIVSQGSLSPMMNAPTAAIAGQIYEFIYDANFGAHGIWCRVS